MIDIDELKRKALAAGGERWTADGGVVWFESGDGAVTAAALTHCDDSAYPPVLDDDIAAHVAGCNPATILELIERLEAAERDAARYRIMEAGADQSAKCLLHLLRPDCRKGYIHDLDVSEHEARPEVQMLAHVLVSERPGKFALIHLVAYLLDAAIAKGKA